VLSVFSVVKTVRLRALRVFVVSPVRVLRATIFLTEELAAMMIAADLDCPDGKIVCALVP
jgi:hypothetical protein